MKHLFLAVLMLLLAAGALLAQGPGGGGMQASGDTLMVTTPKGLFVLRNGVLGKFDPATLKPLQTMALYGELPAQPANNADREAWRVYNAEIQKRMAPPLLLEKDSSLIIVIGDDFARIDQETLEFQTLDLRGPNAPAPAGGRGFRQDAPDYLLVKDTLYLMKGTEILSVDIANVKVLARGPLPKELQPLQFNFGGFGGGNNRGDRNNRNNQ
ncbi:MAG: hypothetical protein ACYDCO_24720 [Armatimonadota bacterium]